MTLLDLDYCSAPYCRKPSDIIVLSIPYCSKHNEERLEQAYLKASKRDVKRGTEGLNSTQRM